MRTSRRTCTAKITVLQVERTMLMLCIWHVLKSVPCNAGTLHQLEATTAGTMCFHKAWLSCLRFAPLVVAGGAVVVAGGAVVVAGGPGHRTHMMRLDSTGPAQSQSLPKQFGFPVEDAYR